MLWSSDFTRMTKLDKARWSQGWFAYPENADSGPVNQYETAGYSERNISFNRSGIHFKVTNEPCNGKLHTGAQITTMKSAPIQVNSYVEARIWLPGRGTTLWDWPGFWMNGFDVPGGIQWPQYGEIDILEVLDSQAAWHYHQGSRAGVDDVNLGASVPGLVAGWHTFAARWTRDRIDFIYDGRVVGSVTSRVQSDPHYIMMGNSTANKNRVGSDMTCSYVKVWAL